MLRSFGKILRGPRVNGGISLLETSKPEEDLEVTRTHHHSKYSRGQDCHETTQRSDYSKSDSQQNRRGKSEGPTDKDDGQPLREAFSLKNALGWASVAAVSLNACQLFESRKKCGGLIPQCPRKPLGSLVARTVLAQPIAQPALKPIASKFYAPSSSSDSDEVHFSDGSDTSDSNECSTSTSSVQSCASDDGEVTKRKKMSKVDLEKQIEEEFRALQEVEEELIREMDTSRVAAHAHLLNQRIGLTTGHGPFAVRDPFEDPERNAFLCFRESSRLGVISATYNLAVCYERGIGTLKDLKMAVKLYKKASDAGHDMAKYNLGALCYQGKVPGCDSETGVTLIREAAKAGVEEAWTALLEMLEGEKLSRKTSVSDCHEELTKGLDVIFKTTNKIPPSRKPRRSYSEPRNLELIDTGYDSSGLKMSPVLPSGKNLLLVETNSPNGVNARV